MKTVLRQSRRDDVSAMHRVRMAVRENRLVSTSISEPDYWRATESDGRGWVIESDDGIVAFAVGKTNGNIWALFVQPEYEGLGFGRQLLDTAVSWLWGQGLKLLWLTTNPNTRAADFYERAGWTRRGVLDSGEIRYELLRSERVVPRLRLRIIIASARLARVGGVNHRGARFA